MTTVSQAKKILLISSHRVGDSIFLTPAITGLKRAVPDATIDLLATAQGAAEVFANNPAINQQFNHFTDEEIKGLAGQYDAVIALYNNSKTQHCGELIGGKIHYPQARPCDIHRRDYFVEFMAGLLPGCDFQPTKGYQLFPQAEHDKAVNALLLAENVDVSQPAGPLICCHLGCYRLARQGLQRFRIRVKTEGSKSWSVKSFIQLNRLLLEKHPRCKLILTGTPGERKLAKPLIRSADNVIDLIGKTSILELAALMRYMHVMITGDTGPMHVACAMQLPLVALFSQTDPSISGPYPPSDNNQVIVNDQLDAITPREVFDRLNGLLSRHDHVAMASDL